MKPAHTGDCRGKTVTTSTRELFGDFALLSGALFCVIAIALAIHTASSGDYSIVSLLPIPGIDYEKCQTAASAILASIYAHILSSCRGALALGYRCLDLCSHFRSSGDIDTGSIYNFPVSIRYARRRKPNVCSNPDRRRHLPRRNRRLCQRHPVSTVLGFISRSRGAFAFLGSKATVG